MRNWLSIRSGVVGVLCGMFLVAVGSAQAADIHKKEKKLAGIVKKGKIEDDLPSKKTPPATRIPGPTTRRPAATPTRRKTMPRAKTLEERELAAEKEARLAPPAAKSAKPSLWSKINFQVSGYLQTGYRYTFNNDEASGTGTPSERPSLLRLGESDGFYLRRVRLNFNARAGHFLLKISGDLANDPGASSSDVTPAQRGLGAALRDAYIRYQNPNGFFAEVGQTGVPFGLFEDRSAVNEHFILFPLLLGGEDIAFGYQVAGITPRRDIGLKVGYARSFGSVGIFAKAMVYNGNGPNRFGNDSDLPAVAARLGFKIGEMLRIGGNVLWNPRRSGEPPSLFEETDLTFGADLKFKLAGFFLEGSFALQQTSFPTTDQKTATAFGFHADLGYRIKALGLEPAVRFEMFDPTDLFDDDQLTYVTFCLNWYHKVWQNHEIAIRLSYTLKLEQTATRTLNNDQLNLMFRYRL